MMMNHTSDTAASNNYQVLGDVLRDACIELMTEYGLSALLQVAPGDAMSGNAASGDAASGNAAIATIDFHGAGLRGTIGLAMTPSVVGETYKAAIGVSVAPDSAEAIDWTCELANQLIGRVHNKLRAYQVSFHVSTPRLRNPSFSAPPGALRNCFLCHQGSFTGYLDVLLAPGLALVRVPPSTPLIDEGELLFF